MDDAQETLATRRTFVKGVLAAGTGIAAAAYVKPSLRVIGVPGALAQVSGEPIPPDSSTTGSNDPVPPSASSSINPLMPATGGGGTAGAPDGASTSLVTPLLGVALASGLLGRRALRALREDHDMAAGHASRAPEREASSQLVDSANR